MPDTLERPRVSRSGRGENGDGEPERLSAAEEGGNLAIIGAAGGAGIGALGGPETAVVGAVIGALVGLLLARRHAG